MKSFFVHVPKSEVLFAFERHRENARAKLLTNCPSYRHDRRQAQVVEKFDTMMDEAYRCIRRFYISPFRPLLKFLFDRIWSRNFYILSPANQGARVHNHAQGFVEKGLTGFGHSFDLLDE